MRIQRLSSLAILAAITTATLWMAAGDRARAAACPFVESKYCVKEKDGFKHTAWTNPCLAKLDGRKILHKGECKGK